ncbi:RNA polymerase sigma factor SigJ [Streptomyces heliomycini]
MPQQLTSARARRETYVGEWLPSHCSPATGCSAPPTPPNSASRSRTAVLTLLERLTPTSGRCTCCGRRSSTRTGRSPRSSTSPRPASQQIFHRAKKHVTEGKARTEIDGAAARRVVDEFLAAAASGRTEPLVRLLTEDAVAVGDGGGKVPARAKAFEGALAVATFLRGLFKPGKAKRALVGGSPGIHVATANGDPALVAVLDGRVVGIMCLAVTAEGITAIRSQANPDKLERATRLWASTDHGDPLFTAF